MQTLEVLIEENAFGSVRPVEVVADAPVSALVPALVEELKLPQTDLFGKKLVYMLRQSDGGRIIPENTTLIASGVQPGTRLALDSYVLDGSVATLTQKSTSENPNLYSSVTIADAPPLPSFGNVSMPSVVSRNTPTSRGNTSDIDLPTYSKRRKSGRRTFLIATGALLGLGGVGVGYAGYRAYMNGGLNTINHLLAQQTAPAKSNAVTTPAATQQMATLPTMAKLQLTFTQHTRDIRVVSWTADGKMLASAADDAHVYIWEPNGTVQRTIAQAAPVTALAWSPDGQRLVTGAGTRIAFYNLAGNILASSTRAHTQTVMSLAWTSHNQMEVVSGGADRRAIVWNTTNYQPQIVYALHTTPIVVVSWSSDGQTIASSSQGGAVRIWDAANAQDLHGYYQDAMVPMRALAYAPTGTQIAVGGDDGTVRLWNNASICGNAGAICKDTPQQRIKVSQTAIRALSWSPDGRFLAVGADDGSFSVWNAAQLQQPLLKVTIQQGVAVHSITWSPDGKQIATASGTMVRLWMLI